MRRVEATLSFTSTADSAAVGPQCSVVAVPWVEMAETRSLNPRKVLVRVNLAVHVQAYAAMTENICAGVLAPEETGVEQLAERCDTCVVACVQEKPFTFADDVAIPGSKPEAEELLKHRVALRCSEAKVIGSKLHFQGRAPASGALPYCGGACSVEYELPFSQIMEVSGAGEESTCQVQVLLTGAECSLESGDRRSICVALGLLAQAVVREERSLEVLTDVYSTAYDLHPEVRVYSMPRLLDCGVKEQTVREILETECWAKEVFDAYVCVGAVSQNREGARLTLSSQINVTVLYLTEEGSRVSVTRPIQASCTLDLPEGAVCSARCSCPSPVFATPTTGGIEVRFPVDFQHVALEIRRTAGVAAIRMDETARRDTSGQPSIVLRMVGPGERLWDLAKAYGTTHSRISCRPMPLQRKTHRTVNCCSFHESGNSLRGRRIAPSPEAVPRNSTG